MEPVSGLLGVSVAVLPLPLTEADTSALLESFNVNVEEVIVAVLRELLNVAVTAVLVLTPVAPLVGVVEVTLRPAGPVLTVKTMSTQ